MNRHMDDDELLSVLARALRRDQPPTRHRDAALMAHAWHNIDAELAQLVHDSLTADLEAGGQVAVRSEDGPRQITFEAPGVEIEITVAGDTRTIVGQLVPPQVAEIRLAVGEGVLDARSDELGRFRFEGVAAGPIRLSVLGSDRRAVHTEWIVI